MGATDREVRATEVFAKSTRRCCVVEREVKVVTGVVGDAEGAIDAGTENDTWDATNDIEDFVNWDAVRKVADAKNIFFLSRREKPKNNN